MNNINLNILILGKTGAGKSSLINYLVSQNLMKTGEGKPVTGQDFETITYNSDSFNLTFVDSWGLEANKSPKWKELVFNKLEDGIDIKIDSENIFSKKVFSIIYCINYKSSRIEDFELNFLEELLQTRKYKILILFTQADNICSEKKSSFTNVITSRLKTYSDFFSIKEACAKKIQLLGQTTAIEAFGKDEIINTLGNNLWPNLINYAINDWYSNCQDLIQKFNKTTEKYIKNLNPYNQRVLHILTPKLVRGNNCLKKMQYQIKKLQEDVKSQLNKNINSAIDYYEKLFEKTRDLPNDLYETYISVRGKYETEDFLASLVVDFIPILGFLFLLSKGSIVKDNLREKKNDCIRRLNEIIDKKRDELEKLLLDDKSY